MEEVLTIRELAARLRVSRPTMYSAVRRGQIAAVRVGNQLRVTETALEHFLKGGGNGEYKAKAQVESRAT